MICFIFLGMLSCCSIWKAIEVFNVITFNLSPESFKFNSSGLETPILLLPWYTKQRGYIVCIPITNYDRGFTQKRAGLQGPKQAERSFFYQVTIECGAILPCLPVAAWGYAPLCVWLHSANVTCNFSPYANQAVKLLSFPVWQSRLWSFQTGVTKSERFLHNNQHTQRKLLNFEFWINGELSKIGHHFSNKVI